MANSNQSRLLFDLVEGLPSIVFIVLWRQAGDLELAGWAGCGVALASFLLFRAKCQAMHPVLLGVNCHLLMATPLIVGMYSYGDKDAAALLAIHGHGAVLLTVTVVGILLTLFTRAGFVGMSELSVTTGRRLSLLMIAVSAVGAAWALLTPENSLLTVIATLSVLIAGRRFLLARALDKSGTAPILASVAAGGSFQPDASA